MRVVDRTLRDLSSATLKRWLQLQRQKMRGALAAAFSASRVTPNAPLLNVHCVACAVIVWFAERAAAVLATRGHCKRFAEEAAEWLPNKKKHHLAYLKFMSNLHNT
jgi:hypothetical protein